MKKLKQLARLVWYTGERVRVDTFDDWKALADGIQGVIEFESKLTPAGVPYRRIIDGSDWYVWDEGRVQAGPGGLPGEWTERPKGCADCIKRSGVNLPDAEWDKLYAEMWARRWP